MDRRRRSPSGRKKKTGILSGLFSPKRESGQKARASSPEERATESRGPTSSRPGTSSLANPRPVAPGLGIPAPEHEAPRYEPLPRSTTYSYTKGSSLPSPPSSLPSQDPVDTAYQTESTYQSDLRIPPGQRTHRRGQSSSSSGRRPVSSYGQSRLYTPPYTPRGSWAVPTDRSVPIPPAAPEAPVPQPRHERSDRSRGQGQQERERQRHEAQPQNSVSSLEQTLRETLAQLSQARKDLAKSEKRARSRERAQDERIAKLEDDRSRRSEHRHRHHRHRKQEDETKPEASSSRPQRRDSQSHRKSSKREPSPGSSAEERTRARETEAKDYIRHRKDESQSRRGSMQASETTRPKLSRNDSQRQPRPSRPERSESSKEIKEARASVEALRALAEAQKQQVREQRSLANLQPTVEEETSEYETDSEDQPRASSSRTKPVATTASSSRREQTPAPPPPRGQSYHRGNGQYINTERDRERTRMSQPKPLRRTVQNLDEQVQSPTQGNFQDRMRRINLDDPRERPLQKGGNRDEEELTDLEDEPSPGIGSGAFPEQPYYHDDNDDDPSVPPTSSAKGKGKEKKISYKYDDPPRK